MTESDPGGLSRRRAFALLGLGVAALAVGGCSAKPVSRALTVTAAVATDPLGPLYTGTVALITAYDQALATAPDAASLLGPLREDHRQHAIALASLMGAAAPALAPGPNPSGVAMIPLPPLPSASIGPSSSAISPPPSITLPPSPPPVPPDFRSVSAPLRTAEKVGQASAVAACLAAPANRVAVLASIAACRASHQAVLA